MAKEAKLLQAQPETRLLRTIITEFRNESNPHIVRLERILSLLLDQDIKQINLILFFDALDEFDGHLDKISDFLKSLVKKSETSATRVKVCFSSRPWKLLNDHFATYPGLRLQDYTKADIERYVTGSLARSKIMNPSQGDKIMKIIPSIITRANGVFLWVRLAMSELFPTVAESHKSDLSDSLEQKLQELPADLFDYYKLIIERISETNRRYTFALLELLVRHAGPPATATDIWGAVLISGCTTFQESLDVLQSQSVITANKNQKVINDILAWGGGLVEIKSQGYLQLMHQTVLEFITRPDFKKIVMGDVAAILSENGHSFYFKYWVTTAGLGRHKTANNTELRVVAAKSHQSYVEERKPAAYHAEKSESTTGISQLDFINSVPTPNLQRLIQTTTSISESKAVLLTFACSYGLTLCISDWIARNPGELQQISLQHRQPPLLSSLAFGRASGVFHEEHLRTAHLLLKNGYSIAKDTTFFLGLLKEMLEGEAKPVVKESNAQAAIVPAIYRLVTLVLDHGQDPNIISRLFSMQDAPQCTLLHVAPPGLAAELIRRKANVNTPDLRGRTPLDWMLRPPYKSLRWSRARRYKMCCLLVNAGGLTSQLTPPKVWTDALTEFDNKGFDTRILRSRSPLNSTQPFSEDSRAQNSKQGHRWPWSLTKFSKRSLGKKNKDSQTSQQL